MNSSVINNYSKLKLSSFYPPLIFLFLIVCFLYKENALHADSYIKIQKEAFFFINSKLAQYPKIQYNLTQTGNALIPFSLLSILIIYAPKIWESLLSASIISLVFCNVLKSFFGVPRPAAVFENNSFFIIGKTVCGNNSLPSGHSITIFTTLTVLLFGFMPLEMKSKILWSALFIITGLILIFTRVAVGAHYPIDVIVGGIIGYFSGLLGIFISRKYNIWQWINNKKYYPVFILGFLACASCLVTKIIDENLTIYYISLIALIISLYEITTVYIKR
ncbi:phosphatase PAP2 family protein [Flavobacterium sp.]|uniref:phosphatase PAP2 family protein n=1 Tax=Flavobacterium sp. TaxID=239 RepID=UPI002ED7E5D1